MAARIRMLEPAQREAMAPHAEQWAVRALDTTGVDWAEWEDGARAVYAFTGTAGSAPPVTCATA